LYSNQKSNRSPSKKSTAASCWIWSSQRTNFSSLTLLFSGLGAPKCWSEAKYIFLDSVNFCWICYRKDTFFRVSLEKGLLLILRTVLLVAALFQLHHFGNHVVLLLVNLIKRGFVKNLTCDQSFQIVVQ